MIKKRLPSILPPPREVNVAPEKNAKMTPAGNSRNYFNSEPVSWYNNIYNQKPEQYLKWNKLL